MSKGGGRTRDVVTQTTALPDVMSAAQFGLGEARRLYDLGPQQYFPGQTVVGPAAETTEALGLMAERARAGSPLVAGAQQLTQQAMSGQLQNLGLPYAQQLAGGVSLAEPMGMVRETARGGFLGGSPGLQAAIGRALDPVEERLQAQQSAAGRYGSAYAQQQTAETLGDIAADIAYQDYARERQNQLAAQQQLAQLQQAQFTSGLQGLGALAGLSQQDIQTRLAAAQAAPAMADLDFAQAQQLAQIGAAKEAQEQAQLAGEIERYQFEQAAPMQALSNYLAMIQGVGPMMGQQQITPQFRNPAAGFLSGAMGAAGLAPGLREAGIGAGAMPYLIGAGGLLGGLV